MPYDILIKPLGSGVYDISGLSEVGAQYLGKQAGKIGYIPLHHLAVRAMADGLTLAVRTGEDRPDVAFPAPVQDGPENVA